MTETNQKKKAELVLEAGRRADEETWRERNIAIFLIAGGMTIIAFHFAFVNPPIYLAIPLLVPGISSFIYALGKHRRKMDEYVEKNIEKAEKGYEKYHQFPTYWVCEIKNHGEVEVGVGYSKASAYSNARDNLRIRKGAEEE